MTHGLGYRKDRPDPRDKVFALHAASDAPVPSFASVDVDTVRAKNQGRTSSCCGQGISQGIRLANLATKVDCPELAALFAYRVALNLDGANVDEGTEVRQVLKAVTNLGLCSESSMPFSESAVLNQPTFAAESDAFDRRGLRGYYRIASGDVDGMAKALAAGFPVVAGWDVTETFCSTDGHSVIGAQTGAMAGGHCMCIVGVGSSADWSHRYPAFQPPKSYARLGRIVQSWGDNDRVYGYSGRIFADEDFLSQATDVWALDCRGAS